MKRNYFKSAFFLVLIVIAAIVTGQDSDIQMTKSAIIYMNGHIDYSNDTKIIIPDSLEDSYNRKILGFSGLSFALRCDNNRFLDHEFEIGNIDLVINSSESSRKVNNWESYKLGDKQTHLSSLFRYQLYHTFQEKRQISPYLGLSTWLYFAYHKINPIYTYSRYKKWLQKTMFTILVTPWLQYKITDRIGLCSEISIPIWYFQNMFDSSEDPNLSEEDRFRHHFENDFFPYQLDFRIGFLYEFK